MSVYIRALRAPFLSASVMPVVLAAAWANVEQSFSWIPFLLTLVGVASLQLGSNLINDWADAAGSDPINFRLTPFSGGSRVIQDGQVSRRTVLKMSFFFFALAMAVGLVLMQRFPLVTVLGGLGLVVGLVYSVRPLSLMSRGVGEISIFFAFGPLITLGTFYVMTGELVWPAFLLGLPLGFLTMGIIWINEFPDYEPDQRAGKRNLVVRLGRKQARFIYPALMLVPFASLPLLVAIGFPPFILVGFGALPLALKACRIFWHRYSDHPGIIPAQALTIQTQLAMGVLTSLGLLTSRMMG